MDPVTALLTLIPIALQVEGGVAQLLSLIGTLHAGGKLTAEQVQTIRDDAALADADFDSAIAAAKARIGK